MPSFERCDVILSAGFHGSRIKRGKTRWGQIYEEARSDECLPERGKRGVYAWFHYGEMLRVPSGGTVAWPTRSLSDWNSNRSSSPPSIAFELSDFFLFWQNTFSRSALDWALAGFFHLPLANHTLISPQTGRTEWNRWIYTITFRLVPVCPSALFKFIFSLCLSAG